MLATVLNYLVLIFLILVVKAPITWGFSISRTEDYVRQVQAQQLWKDPKWIKLGHYEKTLFGYSSAFRGGLFLHPEGYTSPENELITTIQTIFSDSSKEQMTFYKRHPQCQFLARRKWLLSKIQVHPDDILPCEERTEWKKQLGATSVSVIFASADLSNPASSFGHTFLKLVNPENAGNKDLIDYGVNYAAEANENDGFFYAVRGLFGGYRGIYTMLPYHQKIREYLNLEGRDITEYHLNFTPEEVDEMIDHLIELEYSSAPYYFLSDNCSYQILYLLDVIRPELDLSSQFNAWVIPSDTIKAIARHEDNLVANRVYKQSLNSQYLDDYSSLSLGQRRALDEAVSDLKISDNYNLTPKEKAEVYETGMKYYAVEAYRTGRNTENERYTLSTARADLGPITQPRQEKPQLYAETSHDSSAAYLGLGNLNNQSYSLLKFRMSYHDLEQPDVGIVPFSLVQAGVMEFRYFDEIKKFSLHRFTVMNLINTVPITQLDKNISWKARIEILDQFRPDVEYAIGQSYELDLLGSSRISYFLAGRYLKELEEKHRGQVGPEILFITKPTPKLGVSFALAYLAQNEKTPYLRFQSRLNYQIAPNYDIQLYADDLKDYQFSFVKNFIF